MRAGEGGDAEDRVTEAAEVRISYVLGRLDRALRQRLDSALGPLGVTTPQFTALSVLLHRDELSNAQLARRSLITPQSMFSVLKALERKGLIERTPSPDHGRILYTRLTPAGRELMHRCEAAVSEVEGQLLDDFSAAEADILLALATRAVRNLHGGLDDQVDKRSQLT
jgi:DNA-binding MarR family transcriptional regulator